MKFPLFLSTRPASSLVSPTVLLGKGSWKLQSTTTESKILLTVDGVQLPSPEDTFSLQKESEVFASFEFVGKEKEIDVYAVAV